jgi:hypothetical protein
MPRAKNSQRGKWALGMIKTWKDFLAALVAQNQGDSPRAQEFKDKIAKMEKFLADGTPWR